MTRLEKLEISLTKAMAVVEERKTQIAEERIKIESKREEEKAKFLEQKAKFEALYGSLDTIEAQYNENGGDNA